MRRLLPAVLTVTPDWRSALAAAACVGACGTDSSDAESNDASRRARAAADTGRERPPSDAGAASLNARLDGAAGKLETCSFDVEHELSQLIGTVAIVSWSTTLRDIEAAHIEFWPTEGGRTLEAPVDLDASGFRTLLLGMKADRDYQFRIVAESTEEACASDEYTIRTAQLPNSLPRVQRGVLHEDGVTPGFIVTSLGLGGLACLTSMDAIPVGPPVVIFDHEGDIVWYWENTPQAVSRARMAWDGSDMWMLSLNVSETMGELARVSMDGRDSERFVGGLSDAHHDFTVTPDGSVVALTYGGDCGYLVALSDDGEATTIADLATLYTPGIGFDDTPACHPNYVLYHPQSESFTVSDRFANLFVSLTDSGELNWQLGGGSPEGAHFAAEWDVNHGHHLLPNGNFLLFSNGDSTGSRALEFELDDAEQHAELVWSYESGEFSVTLGDVQRLPSGNTLVTYSNAGTIHEVSPTGELVQAFTTESIGYTMHRPSLYGPPPR